MRILRRRGMSFLVLFGEVSEDSSRVDAEILCSFRTVAVVEFEYLVDISLLEIVFCLGQSHDGFEDFGHEVEVGGLDLRLIGEDECFLDAVFELPDVSGPFILSDGHNSFL